MTRIAARRRHARLILGAALALAAPPATAGSVLSTGPDCGGDAYSSAQVVENRPPRRGPLTAVPDTLCADVAPQGPRTPVEIGIYPSLGSSGMPRRDGGRGSDDPYEAQPPRQRRP
ncbi:hypothetical protein [Methylobacterium sp. J-068]|uniref:hypothetical protein n=1 Tax=Methylobacterium sp. J-068 TaxID=2836649 RepID=UPI001FBBFBA0|nr:hypothetical protein [Methylobacterium sp. J-068]MCJ2033809.1 hypothetical protein [Methylobacterium sp. J-068]